MIKKCHWNKKIITKTGFCYFAATKKPSELWTMATFCKKKFICVTKTF
jgi:hypothetical protein